MSTLLVILSTGLQAIAMFAFAWGTLWILGMAYAKSGEPDKYPVATAYWVAFWGMVVIFIALLQMAISSPGPGEVTREDQIGTLGFAWGLAVSFCAAYIAKQHFRAPDPEPETKKPQKD